MANFSKKVTKVEKAAKGCHENTITIPQICHKMVHIGLFLRKFAKINFFNGFWTLLVQKSGIFWSFLQNRPYSDLKRSKFSTFINISALDYENITSKE